MAIRNAVVLAPPPVVFCCVSGNQKAYNAVIKGALKDLRYLDDLNRVLFNNLVKLVVLVMIEAKTYTDGTVVTGNSPLPSLSPKQQDRKTEARKDFKINLISLRTKAGLTQSQLEARAGLPAMVLSHYETGTRKPGLDNIITLCIGLNCTATELLGV